jgi:replication-associated recombination protein RarA
MATLDSNKVIDVSVVSGTTDAVNRQYIDDNTLQNLLLFGPAGVGKTSLAKLIVKQLDAEYLYVFAIEPI